jgi:20S proteasome alpha/beta subunit
MTPARIMTPRGYWRDVPAWERRDMTICIAAGCVSEVGSREYQIVLCSDWQLSSVLGSSETGLKMRRLGKGWWCLTAGTESEINAIIPTLRSVVTNTEQIDETNIPGLIRGVLNGRKKQKVDEFIQGRYGISYDDFLQFGKEKLPTDIHREAFLSLSEITIGCSLIVAGFCGRMPTIIETTDNCRVLIREDYATIGEGAFLAQSVLLQRKHFDSDSTAETIYKVFEAKKYAENVRSVGEDTTIAVINPKGERLDVKKAGRNELEQYFKKYGPQKIDDVSKITNFLEPW